MYYILNGTKQIIAADDSLLALCGVNHINELYLQVAKKETIFDTLSNQNLTLETLSGSKRFNISKTNLSSLIGVLTLVSVGEEINDEVSVPVVAPISHIETPPIAIEEPIKEAPTIDVDDIDALLHSLSEEEEKTIDIRNSLLDEATDVISPILEESKTIQSPIEELAHSIDDSLLFDTAKETSIQIPAPIVKSEPLDLSIDIETPTPLSTVKREPKSLAIPLDMDLLFETPIETPAPTIEPEPLDLGIPLDMDLLFETPIETPAPTIEPEPLDLGIPLDMDLLFETPIETPAPTLEPEPLDLGIPLDMDLLLETPIEAPAPTLEPEPLDLGIPLDADLLFDTPVGTPAPVQTPIVEPVLEVEPVVEPDPIVEIATVATTLPTPEIAEIIIDVADVSNKIGITTEDYNTFLNEFIENAIELEADLEGADIAKRTEAIDTLSDLSHVLYLPSLAEVIHQISITDDTQRRSTIDAFYQALSGISILESKPTEAIVIPEPVVEVTPEPIVIPEPSVTLEPQLTIKEQLALNKTSSTKTFGTISLEGIKPKHFDFQLEEAANDLSLPVELIEEFVHDFIDQANIETKKMLESYEEGDLDAIQKIGHLLKGASSNLRINALSDTLYKIQFCEESKNLEVLIKDYWAHFLSFEHQINVISQH